VIEMSFLKVLVQGKRGTSKVELFKIYNCSGAVRYKVKWTKDQHTKAVREETQLYEAMKVFHLYVNLAISDTIKKLG